MNHEFSPKTRQASLDRFRSETFDLLVIGGGITGAGTARDAASRGLKVALVEARDFAWGTSSRSSKLIHGGLRYLQNMELKLVFEALSERTKLLKLVPHMVRPLEFYLPVYQGDKPPRFILSIGLWLYDLLSLFRTPGFHRSLSRKKLLERIPFLKAEGLKGGFKYYDASMWDDVLSIETLRSASALGASIANYVEATTPLWDSNQIRGFEVLDKESGARFPLRTRHVIVCAGPWTDIVGQMLASRHRVSEHQPDQALPVRMSGANGVSTTEQMRGSGGGEGSSPDYQWKNWLSPSKGIHLIFDLKKLPVPGAMVMGQPEDGRISFVIPRPDFGAGVVIVGTTDGPTPPEPEKASVEAADVQYLMKLLQKYFPKLGLTTADIISAYVGVRPLMGSQASTVGSEGQGQGASLQKVSREHFIGRGPGGATVVAGGKYTTHRTMAVEIVEEALKHWKEDWLAGKAPPLPEKIGPSSTKTPVNPEATEEGFHSAYEKASKLGLAVPEELWTRYGGEALRIIELSRLGPVALESIPDPDGFPLLSAQLRYTMQTGMALHLEDFYLRRTALYASRMDHGLPWAEALSHVWAEALGKTEQERTAELEQLKNELELRSGWKRSLGE